MDCCLKAFTSWEGYWKTKIPSPSQMPRTGGLAGTECRPLKQTCNWLWNGGRGLRTNGALSKTSWSESLWKMEISPRRNCDFRQQLIALFRNIDWWNEVHKTSKQEQLLLLLDYYDSFLPESGLNKKNTETNGFVTYSTNNKRQGFSLSYKHVFQSLEFRAVCEWVRFHQITGPKPHFFWPTHYR